MDNALNSAIDSSASKIGALRGSWTAAVNAGEIDRLSAMSTEEIVVVHADGQCTQGKEELKLDFFSGFERFDTQQRVISSKVIVHDKWAIEISKIETSLTSTRASIKVNVQSMTVFVYACQPDNSWKVARILELPD